MSVMFPKQSLPNVEANAGGCGLSMEVDALTSGLGEDATDRGHLPRRLPSANRGGAVDGADLLALGVEEEFHVVELESRALVARAPDLLDDLPEGTFSAELHRSVVETSTEVCTGLGTLRRSLVGTRHTLGAVAAGHGLGVVAAGTVPLVDPLRLAITPTDRYQRMLDDYQMLVREQLICGAQVHVQVADRDLAVAIAGRLTPYLPLLLALSASSPFWFGEDSGYASIRSLIWQRWPTAGLYAEVGSAAEHDAMVKDLIASEVISDAGMLYFDVRPSAHLPTLEMRISDACPDVDDVVMLAGLFRALVRQQAAHIRSGRPRLNFAGPLLRAAIWRAARSGMEAELLDLPRSPRPVPAAQAAGAALGELRPYLEETGDWSLVSGLVERAVARGTSAALQRRAYQRRGRLADVVDMLLAETVRQPPRIRTIPSPDAAASYTAVGDEVFPAGDPSPHQLELIDTLSRVPVAELRHREIVRDEEQRAAGVTFGAGPDTRARLFPVDLIPRVVAADEWSRLRSGLLQRARALNAFLGDVYGARAAIADGIIPADVIDGAPGLRPTGALAENMKIRAQVAGMDLVRDASGTWRVLEDNLRVPSGLAYAMQNRRLTQAVMSDLPAPPGLLPVDGAAVLLREALRAATPDGCAGEPQVALLSEGPLGPAWFEHRMLAEELDVALVTTGELIVENDVVHHSQDGARHRLDVLYLRIEEEALLHSIGADGKPLGPPLLAAVAAGRVTLANALGNGVADDKAVYAFVPRFIEYFLGERPLLECVPTYLCADPDVRSFVLDRISELVLKPVDGYGGEGVLIGPLASDAEIDATHRQLVAAPHRWIAQDPVAISTHPCFDGLRLTPRHVDLRAFVITADRPQVAPAALTRVAPAGSMVVNSSRGGGSKDTWLLADNVGGLPRQGGD